MLHPVRHAMGGVGPNAYLAELVVRQPPLVVRCPAPNLRVSLVVRFVRPARRAVLQRVPSLAASACSGRILNPFVLAGEAYLLRMMG